MPYLQGNGKLLKSMSAGAVGLKPSSRLSIANLIAFQSLLHQWRYAITRLMSRLMSRP